MTLKVLTVWNGNNFVSVIQALSSQNEELKIRVQGKKLIIKDDEAGFYRCIPIGEVIEIPDYESNKPIQNSTQEESGLWERGNILQSNTETDIGEQLQISD